MINCLLHSHLKKIYFVVFVFNILVSESSANDINTNIVLNKKRHIAMTEVLTEEQKLQESKYSEIKIAIQKMENKEYKSAIEILKKQLESGSSIKDYLHYFLGVSNHELDNKEEAKIHFNKVLENAPNLKLLLDTHRYLGLMAKNEKKYKEAFKWFSSIEKRIRGQESYSDLIYNLLEIELSLNSKNSCKWALKLYSEYPQYASIDNWTVDLKNNIVNDKKVNCSPSGNDIKKRLRRLDLVGKSDKAKADLERLKSEKFHSMSKYEVAKLEAGHWIHEGDVAKSIQLLKAFSTEKEMDTEYLMDMASLYSRTNELLLANNLYYEIFQKNKKTKWSKEALFQSAFLAYQIQDYPLAEKRFKEFQSLFPDKGIYKDVKWYLGWCRYLSKDYRGAISQWEKLLKENSQKKSLNKDKILYWKSVAHFRMGELERAYNYLKELSEDKLLGYYSLVARHRMNKILPLLPKRKLAIKDVTQHLLKLSVLDSVIPENEYLDNLAQSNGEESGISISNTSIESVSSDFASSDEKKSEKSNKTDSRLDLNIGAESEEEIEQSEENIKTNFANPVLVKKFERAQELKKIGLFDDMKWEYFEIERKTSNKEYLKSLMKEYDLIGIYNRSSYISQTYFTQLRSEFGLDGVRYLWEYAYPKAYFELVQQYSKENLISSELVWSIMRAESQYKKDVISPVGALGLLQMMPYTADKVANLLNIKNFQPTLLFQPTYSVQFGTKYLARLEKFFKGQHSLVAAAYNAGPHRVHNWLGRFGGLELDEFIEHIPFLETRNYVKKVLTNINIYSRLYTQKNESQFGLADSIDLKISENSKTKETWDEI